MSETILHTLTSPVILTLSRGATTTREKADPVWRWQALESSKDSNGKFLDDARGEQHVYTSTYSQWLSKVEKRCASWVSGKRGGRQTETRAAAG